MKKPRKWILGIAAAAVVLVTAAAIWFFRPVHPKVDWTEETPVRVWYRGKELSELTPKERWKITGLVEELACTRALGAYEETGEELFTLEIRGADSIRLWFPKEGDRGRIRVNETEYSFRGEALWNILQECQQAYQEEQELKERQFWEIMEPMWQVVSAQGPVIVRGEHGEEITEAFLTGWNGETDRSKEHFARYVLEHCSELVAVAIEPAKGYGDSEFRHRVYAYQEVCSSDGAARAEFLWVTQVALAYDQKGEVREMQIGGWDYAISEEYGGGGWHFDWELTEETRMVGKIFYTPIYHGEGEPPKFEKQSIIYVADPS